MKPFRSTWILAALIGLIVGYTVYDFKAEKKSQIEKEKSERLLSFEPGAITLMRYERSGDVMTVEKRDGLWQVTSPLQDRGDEEAMQAYLNGLSIERAQELKKEGRNEIPWAEYYLDQPGLNLELIGGPEPVKVSVSRLAAFDGQYYLRYKDRLYLGATSWARHMDKTPSHFRSKHIFRNRAELSRLTIEHRDPASKGSYSIEKKDGQWKLVGQDIALDNQRVEKLIQAIQDTKVLEFTTFDVKEVKPALILRAEGLSDKTALQWSVSVSAEKDNTQLLLSSDFVGVAKILPTDIADLFVQKGELRDGRAPFRGEVEKFREVRISWSGKSVTAIKENDQWQLKSPQEGQKLDTTALQDVFTQVLALEASDFPAGKKFEKSDRSIEFLDASGQLLMGFQVGEEFTPQTGPNKGSSMRLVRNMKDKELLAVASGDLDRLPFERLISSETAPSQQSEKR